MALHPGGKRGFPSASLFPRLASLGGFALVTLVAFFRLAALGVFFFSPRFARRFCSRHSRHSRRFFAPRFARRLRSRHPRRFCSASLRSAALLSSLSSLSSLFAASLRSAEIGRAADAAQARASPASLTDGEDAVGTSRASARRTSGPVVGIFRRLAARDAPPGLKFHCLHSGGARRCRGASPPANQRTPLRGSLSASLRSAASLSSLSSLLLRLASLGGSALVTLVTLVSFCRLASLGGNRSRR